MKREPFASAAGLRWRRFRALALLAAGLAPDIETGTRPDRQFAQAIAARLTHGDANLVWQIDDVVASGSMVATLDRKWFESLVSSIPRERRSIAIRSSEAVDAADAWDFFATEEDAKDLRAEGWRFWVSARVRDLNLPTRPPLGIGYFATTAAELAAKELAEDEDLHPAFKVSALTRATPHCHIQIVCDRDLESAVEHVTRTSAAIGGSSCDLAVVLLKEGLPEHARMRAFVRLRDTLGARGLLVGQGDADAAFELTRTLVSNLAEDIPLWQHRLKTRSGPAMLMCDERMAIHLLSTWTPESEEASHPGGASRPRSTTTVPPGAAKPFPFLPDSAELKRGATAGSGPKAAAEGSRPIRGGPKRRQGGTAPLEPRGNTPVEDSFGKVKGAPPPSAAGPGWIPPSASVPLDPEDIVTDEKPGKPRGRKRTKAPIVVTGEKRPEATEPETPEAFEPAAEPQASAPDDETGTREATILLGGSDGAPTLTAESDDGTTTLRLSDAVVRAFATAFDAAMSDISRDPARYAGVHAPGTAEVLRTLAQRGGALRGALEQDGGLPRAVARIQVASAGPAGTAFPVEYLYALEPPDDDAAMCERAEEGLRAERAELDDGWCSGCAPTGRTEEDQRGTLCPLAFLGARCAIERGGVEPEPGHAAGGVLHPLRCAMVAVTDRVETADAEAMADALRAGVGTLVEAEDWSDWEYDIKRSAPTMLALLAHQKSDVRYGTPQLEIGMASTLNLDALRLSHVRASADAPPPLALVIGRERALSDAGFESFATALQSLGAIVVTTVAPIGAHAAAPVAAGLVGAIAKARQPVSLAELMSDVRRGLLADGTPAVLSLVTLADADRSVDGAV